jgi:ribose-phosphate pyrophosphokinase
MNNNITVLSGNANRKLSEAIVKKLGTSLGDAIVDRFPEGEIYVHIKENIRGKDVFIIQSICSPPNHSLMELLIMIDAAKRASAKRITAVIPYFGYARQDRKDKPRVPITAKLVANLITIAGASRVLTMDLHAGQIQGFFDIPVDHLYAITELSTYFVDKKLKDLTVVSPDVGGVKMARAYAKILNAPLAIVDKRREGPRQVSVMNIIGDVKDQNVVIVDDMISTGGSLVEAAAALKKAGALDIYACVVHPVLAGDAVEKINNSVIKELVVSDSIPTEDKKTCTKLKVLSVSSMLAEAIKRTHLYQSISSLFANASVEA